MKRSAFIFLGLFLISFGLEAQTPGINYFYHTYKRHEDARKFSIPGWVFRLGSTIAQKHVDGEGEKEAIKMAKKIKKLRLLVMENTNSVSKDDVNRMLSRAKGKEGFEDLLMVSSEGTKINMLARSKGDMIKNLLILVSEEDQFVMVSLKSKLKISDLNKLLRSLQDEVDVDLGVEPPEEKKEEVPPPVKKEETKKKKAKKVPARA